MEMDDLKDEIIAHLAEMSNLRVVSNHSVSYDGTEITEWILYEDIEKETSSDWIEKENQGSKLGRVSLRESTKLYFTPEFKESHRGPAPETMLLANLVSPDSFDVAISTLKHALNVLNVCKPPKGTGLFGSATPPGMPGMPPFPFG